MRNNSAKQAIAYKDTILWDNIPSHFKDLSLQPLETTDVFLLSEQHYENLYLFSPFYYTIYTSFLL